ncbi:MAG: dadA [Chlamydiales bacterium]|nr:dadA [Chlamydiales bacterium]
MRQYLLKFLSGILCFSMTIPYHAFSEQVEKLIPPILNQNTLLEKVVCTRPMREGRFNISYEKKNLGKTHKEIINCYGHGGSGWTTLFGSIKKAIELFQDKHREVPPQTMPIRVIGTGCMGLTAAIELNRLGYKVAGITTKNIYEGPSWQAAGYFALVSVKTSPEEQANLNEIGMETFKVYQQIERGQHPYLTKDAVRFMPVYCSDDTEAGVEDLEARGLIPPKQKVTLDFGNGVQHPNFIKYMTYFMDTTALMRQLHKQVGRLSIPIQTQEVKQFSEIKEEIIFNCSGLGSRELNGDDQMIPVRGHLILLNEKAGTAHMDYMIYSKVLHGGLDEYIYMFPKKMVIDANNLDGRVCQSSLGGTFIPHTDLLTPEKLKELDDYEFKKMLDRNSLFFHGKTYDDLDVIKQVN